MILQTNLFCMGLKMDDNFDNEEERLYRSLQSKMDKLVSLDLDEVLSQTRYAAESLEQASSNLDALERRGFVWTSECAELLETARAESRDMLDDIEEKIDDLKDRYGSEIQSLRKKVRRVSEKKKKKVKALLKEVKRTKKQVESNLDSVEDRARPFLQRCATLRSKLEEYKTTMDQFDDASIALLPKEYPFAAVPAHWKKGNEEIEGMLYLSNMRLRFEQQEKVATKTFLFITTESKLVRKMLLDAAIGNIEKADSSVSGLVFKDQLLSVHWSAKEKLAEYETVFEMKEKTAEHWERVLDALRTGEYMHLIRGRDEGAKKSAVGDPISWPSHCSNCTAPLPTPVKGQASLECVYCGSEHAVELSS